MMTSDENKMATGQPKKGSSFGGCLVVFVMLLGVVLIFGIFDTLRLEDPKKKDPEAYVQEFAETPEYWPALKELFPDRYDDELVAGAEQVMRRAREHALRYLTGIYQDQYENMSEALSLGRASDPAGTAILIAEASRSIAVADAIIPRGEFDELIEARLTLGIAVACEEQKGFYRIDQETTGSSYRAVSDKFKRLSQQYDAPTLYVWVEAGAADYIDKSKMGASDGDTAKACTKFFPFIERSEFMQKIRQG